MEWTGMAVFLGCGTPKGKGPPVLGAWILWEKGLFLSAWILGKSLKAGRGPPRCSPALNHCTGHRWSPAPPAHQTARSALAALPDACGARAVRTGFLATPLGDAQYVGPAPRRHHQ